MKNPAETGRLMGAYIIMEPITTGLRDDIAEHRTGHTTQPYAKSSCLVTNMNLQFP